VTADRDVVDDSGPVTDSTATNRHAPVRQVISINGEDEDADDMNIHDFTTFEQEQLIGSRFVRKRRSAPAIIVADVDGDAASMQHTLSTFRSAVRAVLTSEAILEAMRHYNHRSDTETEDDDDSSECPPPLAAGSDPAIPPADSRTSENPDLPMLPVSAAEPVPTPAACDSCRGESAETDVAVDSTCSPAAGGPLSAASDGRVEASDVRSSTAAVLVVDEMASSCEPHVGTDVVVCTASEAGDMTAVKAVDGDADQALLTETDLPPTQAVDVRGDKAPLKDEDLSRREDAAVADTADETAKPTDGLLTATADDNDRDTGCRCCSMQ